MVQVIYTQCRYERDTKDMYVCPYVCMYLSIKPQRNAYNYTSKYSNDQSLHADKIINYIYIQIPTSHRFPSCTIS